MAPPSEALLIRTAVSSDVNCISVLATYVFVETYAVRGIRRSIAAEALEHFSPRAIDAQFQSPSTTFVVAELSGHMIGFAQMTHGTTHALVPDQSTTELNRLYVHERFSRRGVGKGLLRRVEELSALCGSSALWLTAWVGNDRAFAFYKNAGYADVGVTTYVFQDEELENIVFLRSLHSMAQGSPHSG